MKTYTKAEVIVLLNKLLTEHNDCLPDSYSQMSEEELLEYLNEFVKNNLKE